MIPASGRVLGIDLGSKRVGVAISDSGQTVASGLTVLIRSTPPEGYRHALAQLLADEGAVGAVIGLPLSLDGTAGPAARAALAEVESLSALLQAAPDSTAGGGSAGGGSAGGGSAGGVVIETCDERLTTVSAARALRDGGRRGRKARQVVDAVAATLVLQSWLDRRRAGGRADSIRPEGEYR